MLLTIGMIVKNEEKYLERCLNGIKPILDNVDSELIITDTGSTDSTVEIAEKFTDRILHFEWVNDFAAARNTALEIAKGEWFMFLDADEIFESCDGIINFFNSGEYKNYNSAMYIIRNLIYDENGSGYNEFYASRIVKIEDNTRFQNSIHEVINTLSTPYKNIPDVAVHYGYYFDNDDIIQKKFIRNSEPLLKRLETDRDNPTIYKQLYEVYHLVNKYEEALDYLNTGIGLCIKNNDPYLPVLYFHKASFYFSKEDHDNAVAACNDYFHMSSVIRPSRLGTDSEIYAIKAESLYKMKRYREAVSVFENFFDTYSDIVSGKLDTPEFNLITRYMSCDTTIPRLLNEIVECCIKTGEYVTAETYLKLFPVYKHLYSDYRINDLIVLEINMLASYPDADIISYYEMLGDTGKERFICQAFIKYVTADDHSMILRQLEKLTENSDVVKAKLSLYDNLDNDTDIQTDLIDFIENKGIENNIDLIYLIFKKQCDVSIIFSAANIDLKNTAYFCCRNIKGFYEAAENYNISKLSNISILPVMAKFYDYCISMRLMDNEDKSEEEKKQLIGKLFRIKNELNERCKRENSAKSEFELLAEAVKKNIRAFIAKGDIDAARKTLEDYKKINPSDPEIAEITSQIN